jgi:Domain of unknown function (DUF4785) C-terminal domain
MPGPAPRPRARLLGALIALVALGALLLWWLARGPARAPDAAGAGGSPTGPVAGGPAQASAMPSVPVAPPGPHPDRGPAAEPMVPLGPTAAPAYPPGSQPLTEGTDPALSVPEDDPVDSDHPHAIRAIFSARRDVVHPPDPLVFDLKVVDATGKHLPVTGAYARFRSERASPEAGPWFRADFTDDGRGADRAAGDLSYTVTFRPSRSEQEALLGFRLFVEIGFDAPDGLGPRVYGGSVMYTELPHGHLDGHFTEAVVDGSLVIGAGVTVDEPGRFKVIASLYAADGQRAIAFAQHSMQLEAGARSVPLTFFGKILHDAGIDGPYVLRYMMLFEDHPDRGTYAPGVTVDPAYTTHAYEAASFSPEPYQPPPPTGPVITATSPSQQGKPPPMFGAADRARGSVFAPATSTPAPDPAAPDPGGGPGAPPPPR